jgi:hypothetical protein
MRSRNILLCTVLTTATIGLTSTDAKAGSKDDKASCATVADVGSKVWKHAGPVVKNAVSSAGPWGATAAKAIQFIEKGIKIWNDIAGDQSWAKIGPRRMDFGSWNTGTLIGPTERMFVSAIPAVNPVTVDFHKLDHDGKVKVVVCKIPEKGGPKVVKSFTVDNKTKVGKVKSIDIDDAKGNIITVVLHGKSVAKKLQYKVRTKMNYDDSRVQDEGTTRTAKREDPNTKTAPRTNDSTKTAPRTNDATKTAPRTAPKTAPKTTTKAKRAPR